MVPMNSRPASVVFLDLAGFSHEPDPVQVEIANGFRGALQTALQESWGRELARGDLSAFLVLPTGDGAAVVLFSAPPAHPSCEFSAIWLGARMLTWAIAKRVGLRCGVNWGVLDGVQDVYGLPNVCGAAINVAQRVMDGANPGQLLVTEPFLQRLNPREGVGRGDLQFRIGGEVHELLVKHRHKIPVRSIAGDVVIGGTPVPFGMDAAPEDKWHLQVEPTILHVDERGRPRYKRPPVRLLLEHNDICFVGATNGQLADMVREAVGERPEKRWGAISVLFLSDDKLTWLADTVAGAQAKRAESARAREELAALLPSCCDKFGFFHFEKPFFFGSFWDWNRPGGRIHVSPYVWGADVRQCPGLDFVWLTAKPTAAYEAYRQGLDSLLREATPIA